MSADDPKIQWMYEGPKSSVNREDYLLGKKIGKNFELYSDVLVKDKDEKEEDVFKQGPQIKRLAQDTATSSKTSALNLDVVRIEDPLVALRMREEQKKRDLLDNPIMKLKAQRILKSVYEKEKSKNHDKKSKKKHKHRSRSSSSSDDSDKEERRKRKRRHSEHERDDRHHRRHEERRSSRSEKDSRSEDRQSERTHHRHHEDTRPGSSRATGRKALSAEELEERRRAMMGNAQWRDKVRDENLQRAQHRQQREEEMAEKSSAPTFIRPLVSSAAEQSVEDRLSRNKNKIQRSHGYMDKSFTRK